MVTRDIGVWHSAHEAVSTWVRFPALPRKIKKKTNESKAIGLIPSCLSLDNFYLFTYFLLAFGFCKEKLKGTQGKYNMSNFLR